MGYSLSMIADLKMVSFIGYLVLYGAVFLQGTNANDL